MVAVLTEKRVARTGLKCLSRPTDAVGKAGRTPAVEQGLHKLGASLVSQLRDGRKVREQKLDNIGE